MRGMEIGDLVEIIGCRAGYANHIGRVGYLRAMSKHHYKVEIPTLRQTLSFYDDEIKSLNLKVKEVDNDNSSNSN